MFPMGIVILIPVVFAIGLLIRLTAGSLDRDRVKQYVESQGGRLMEAHWAPFGPGWFGEKSDRIYQVRYIDREGNEHEAHCKTSTWSGVYFTQDRIVRQGQSLPRAGETLEEENRRLRAEVERLKRERP